MPAGAELNAADLVLPIGRPRFRVVTISKEDRLMSRILILLALGASVAAAWVAPVTAAAPRELKWGDLVPRSAQEAKRKLKTFFGPRNAGSGANSVYIDSYDVKTRPEDVEGAPPPRIPEAKWMSHPTRPANSSVPPEIRTELDGETVKIGGYVVPLDFNATKVTEFLLVPFVGACIHVPPPPANQIIYVKAEDGFEVRGEFDPVYVTGTISAKITPTGLAETGYMIDSATVDRRAN